MSITHAKVSALSDGPDSSQVQPSDWNTAHVVPFTYDHLTADEAGVTDANLVNTGLSFAVLNGVCYKFKFNLAWRTTVSTVAPKFGLTVPTFTIFTAEVQVTTVTSINWGFAGVINASGGSVTNTSITGIPTNADLPAVVEGVLLPTANGTLMLQYAAETTGATVTLRQASAGELIAMP